MMRPVTKRKYRWQYSTTRTPPKENGTEHQLPSCRRLPPASTLRNPYAPKFPSRVRAPLADEHTFRRMYETSARMPLPSLQICAFMPRLFVETGLLVIVFPGIFSDRMSRLLHDSPWWSGILVFRRARKPNAKYKRSVLAVPTLFQHFRGPWALPFRTVEVFALVSASIPYSLDSRLSFFSSCINHLIFLFADDSTVSNIRSGPSPIKWPSISRSCLNLMNSNTALNQVPPWKTPNESHSGHATHHLGSHLDCSTLKLVAVHEDLHTNSVCCINSIINIWSGK